MTKTTKGTAEPAPGEDNNKRLAFLESGVSALAIALVANGIALGDGEDPIEAAIAGIKAHAANNAELAEALEAATADDGKATPGEIAAIARAEAAELANVEAEKELEQLRHDISDLEEKVAKLEELAGVAPAPAPEPRARPATARDFGPTFGSIEPEELGALIEDGTAFEIAFSNGDHEIIEIEPQPITAAQLRPSSDGRRTVETPVFVRGAGHFERIHGAALLKDGEQVAYCSFPTPVELENGQERRFDRSFIF